MDETLFLLTPKKRAYYIGWVGHGNLGDQVLFLSCERLLGKEITFYKKQYMGKGVRIFLKNQFDLLILGGGTLINRASYFPKFRSIESKKRIVFGTGVADPSFSLSIVDKPQMINDWVTLLNRCDYIGVRGPRSKNILQDWGLKKDVHVIGDPALALMRKEIIKKNKKKMMGINIGFTNGELWGGDDEHFLRNLIDQLIFLGKRGWSFKFFPVFHKDLEFIQTAMNKLKKFGVTYVKDYLNINSFFSNMNSVDIFIGEKLHSVILAICSHTPSIMLEYRPKCLDFMMSIGAEEYVIRTDQIDKLNIVEKVYEIYGNIDIEQERFFEKTLSMKNTLISAANDVIKIIHDV